MKEQKKVERLVHRQLDKLYGTCKGVAKSWRAKGVNMGVLSHVIDMSKFKDDAELPDEFKKGYNTMLDELLKTCQQQSIEKAVSFKDLRDNIDAMKRMFSEGLSSN